MVISNRSVSIGWKGRIFHEFFKPEKYINKALRKMNEDYRRMNETIQMPNNLQRMQANELSSKFLS